MVLRTLAGVVAAAALVGSLRGAVDARQAPPQPTTVAGAVGHVYKTVGGHELRLHVFEPSGWKPGDRRTCFGRDLGHDRPSALQGPG